MKIAYLTGEYPRATDTFIQREVSHLRKHGLEINTFSVRRPSSDHLVGEEQQSELAKTDYLLPLNPFFLLWCHLSCLIRNPYGYWQGAKLALQTSQPGFRGGLYQLFYFLEAAILAYKICRQDIWHIHNHIATSSCTVAMLAAKIRGGTFSFTMHGPHIFFEPYRWRLDEKIRQARFVSCISNFCRSQGMLFVSPEHWPKLQIIHCGVEPELFTSVKHVGQGNRLLYVGRLAAMKGLPVLFEALNHIKDHYPNVKLTIVGDGSEREEIRTIAQALDLENHVDFVGYQSQTAVREYLQESDILVLPSFAEGIPVVLMEAMAAGVPVLTTQIAGIPELVAHCHSGWLVPPGNVTALAEGLVTLIDNADLRSRLGKVGKVTINAEFNVDLETKKMADFFTHN